jgi:hypothetical protein
MNVREILQKVLSEQGADGICNPSEECGCGIDDLAPCDSIDLEECQAAKWTQPAKDDADYDDEFPEGYYKVME